jgi:hypothetical protein
MTDPAKVKEVVERLRMMAQHVEAFIADNRLSRNNQYEADRQVLHEAATLLESLSAEITALREGGDVGLETSTEAEIVSDMQLWEGDAYDQDTIDRCEFAVRETRRRDKLLARTGQQSLRRVRHKKRGSTYEVVGEGRMQAEKWRVIRETGTTDRYGFPEGDLLVADMREIVIYRAEKDGSLWARPKEEFEDGRFEELDAQTVATKYGKK